MNILLVGFGNVGRGLIELLAQNSRGIRMVGITTKTRGSLFCECGLDSEALLMIQPGESLRNYAHPTPVHFDRSTIEMINETCVDVLVDASPTILPDAEPAISWTRSALDQGKHVVLANKAPLVADHSGLLERAKKGGARLLYEATVMAGTPIINLARYCLNAGTNGEVRGILNGTCNYILTRMAEGLSFEKALTEAQSLGYAEADPSADIDGVDTAVKLVILSQVFFNQYIPLEQVEQTSLREITVRDIQHAQNKNLKWKYVGILNQSGAKVAPVVLPIAHPLSHVSGANNALSLNCDPLGELLVQGPGAGGKETAFGILNDLLEL